ncbi:glycine/betaine ABC transporter substrate-binding protein [Ammoniphilus oxalaticus]|uniref:Glycine/betaine ABC transporter substrate-binding protein n=2 Tax=Ammoniphilus oxalaticus TaxID=66863 RepID=A0A419SHF7_9BACL|nr:glycine/betaine ABC transporter substrate-binding protein [Ammoniphilus oxalaticus]
MRGFGAFAVAGLVLAGCGGGGADVDEGTAPSEGESNKNVTITIGETPWTSTIPPTYIAKQIIEDMGYEVGIKAADVGVVFTGLSTGDADVFMDAWLPDMHKNFMEKYADKIVDTAVSYPDGELGWVVPTYVEDVNSVEDLIGKEDLFGGTVYGIEEGAPMSDTSREIIEAYGLDLEYVGSSESGMLAQAKKLIQAEKPVIFLGWRPHPMFVDFDLKVIEDPKEFFKASQVHVITHNGLAEKAPDVFDFLSKWEIPVEDIEKMIVELDQGMTAEEVAKKWIEENEDKVKEMIKS